MLIHALVLSFAVQDAPPVAGPKVTVEELRVAARVQALDFGDEELALMLPGVSETLAGLVKLRAFELDNSVAPVLTFDPFLPELGPRPAPPTAILRGLPEVARPADMEELAFADIATLASLVKSKRVSCLELTELFLARLNRLDPQLLCVVTLCEERARKQAAELDRELAAGRWRGFLHGIPWGAKDLLATRGIRTTWGTPPYEQQVLDQDAEVVRRLDAAGAVLVAKLALGELAMDDVWFGGQTKNPWKLDQGSSGSSAGPASAVAAGCVPFAIGSETCGSIVSPSARCGVTSLRPTFGRVSRRGAMALCWSMDKLGPMCRSVGDAAIVFEAIQGRDALDPSTRELTFVDPGPQDVRGWKVGYAKGTWRGAKDEEEVLAELAALGVELVPVDTAMHTPVEELFLILAAEASAAFDVFETSGQADRMVRQTAEAWPNFFRSARFVSAVDYIRANRVRRELLIEYEQRLEGLAALVHPSVSGHFLVLENLTGHPCVVLPRAFRDDGTPRSISFSGRLGDDARLLALAEAWQRSTRWHEKHPTLR